MKKRILTYGISAVHDSITSLSDFADAVSLSDFDAFVFEPDALTPTAWQRRQAELRELLNEKGGIAICVLRPVNFISAYPTYSIFQGAAPAVVTLLVNSVRAGAGTSMTVRQSARGASRAFFQVLQSHLTFTAFIDGGENSIVHLQGTVFAVNSIGKVIAAEFPVSEGRISLVPVPHNVPGDRLGAAIAKMVKGHFSKEVVLDAPAWVEQVQIPGADTHTQEILRLGTERDKISERIVTLQSEQQELLNYARLLFSYGKGILEPQVRAAFRILGFVVPEPDEYNGEWDVELRDNDSKMVALGEVEGTEDIIDIDKFRQLLNYIQAEAVEGRDYKGVLIGNGFRLLPADAPERQKQFSEHVLRGAARFQFCLLATTELFKAVCAVLEASGNESLKRDIRESILRNVGTWKFQR